MLSLTDTIVAVATPLGEGGISIVRISGPKALSLGASLLKCQAPAPRRAILTKAIDPNKGFVIDEVLALAMPGPHSYTAEDVLEIHCHGGRAPANAIVEAALSLGLRVANPGEFTMRAYMNGRIDLLKAEAVADIIGAKTTEALRVHEEILSGSLSKEVDGWLADLMDVLMVVESHLDFEDEDDIPPPDWSGLCAQVSILKDKIDKKLGSYAYGKTAREGFKVAILGAPNVGKSSLINALSDTDRAIVSHIPGTTRDTIDVTVNVLGVPVTIVDTAGLRLSDDPIEALGIERARAVAQNADLRLMVFDGARPLVKHELDEALAAQSEGRVLVVINKADVAALCESELAGEFGRVLKVSAKSGEGLGELMEAVKALAFEGAKDMAEGPITRLRHKETLGEVSECLAQALRAREEGQGYDALASDLQRAMQGLYSLLGKGTPDDVLGLIFANFCIGK